MSLERRLNKHWPEVLRWIKENKSEELEKICFEGQSKVIGPYPFAFKGSDGFNYHKLEEDAMQSVDRKAHMDLTLMELSRGFSQDDCEQLADIIETNVQGMIDSKNPKVTTKFMNDLIEVAKEVRRRKEYFVHPELYWSLVAHLYIREDEEPKWFNRLIHDYKVKQFRADAKTGAYDFFLSPTLRGYIPLINELEKLWLGYLEMTEGKINAFKEHFSQGQKSLKHEEVLTT
jgi:hypothetical protein